MQKLKKYSAELKLKAVKAYLSGEGSYRDISRKFGISHHDILRDWVCGIMVIKNLRSVVALKEISI